MKRSTLGLLMSLAAGCASTQTPTIEEPIAAVVPTTERCRGWINRRAELQTLLTRATETIAATQTSLAETIVMVDQADQLIDQLRKQNSDTNQALRDREAARVLMKRVLNNITSITEVSVNLEDAIRSGDYECND